MFELRWLGSAIVGPVALPRMTLAKVDGEARIFGVGCCCFGSFSGSSCFVGSGRDGGGGLLVSGAGCCRAGKDTDAPGLPSRRKPPFVSDAFDNLLAASLSLRDIGVPDGLSVGPSEREACGVEGLSGTAAAAFSPSFFFRAAAKAASFDILPPDSGAPPNNPSRGYNGSTRISVLRWAGTLSQGQSRKKSAAEKCASAGRGAGNPGTGRPVRTMSKLPGTVSLEV